MHLNLRLIGFYVYINDEFRIVSNSFNLHHLFTHTSTLLCDGKTDETFKFMLLLGCFQYKYIIYGKIILKFCANKMTNSMI